MDAVHTTTLPCPACRRPSAWQVHPVIDAERDPEARRLLLAGQLFEFHCPHCGSRAQLPYPCLYRDGSRSLALYLSPAGQPTPSQLSGVRPHKGCTLRMVDSVSALLEKIHLFEDGLDDRAMELAKLLAGRSYAAQHEVTPFRVLYSGLEATGQIALYLAFEGAPSRNLLIERSAYDQVRYNLDSNRPAPLVVDRAWAERFISEV